VSGRAARHGNAGLLELLADCAPMNAQCGSDLAQGPTPAVHGRLHFNVHDDTVASINRIDLPIGCLPGQVLSDCPMAAVALTGAGA
jgi:hypothetical protein